MAADPHAVRKAEYYVEQFEARVARARGQNMGDTYEAKTAMSRVKELAQANPDDPAVTALVERVRKALVGSKGDIFEITPEMLAYREAEGNAVRTVAAEGERIFGDRLRELRDGGKLIDPPFPIVDPWEGAMDPERCHVHLEEVEYPKNMILDTGRQFLFVGEPTRGYYFLDLGSGGFRSAYNAIRRYMKTISPDIGGAWQVIGRVTGLKMAIPDPSLEPTRPVESGWQVEVEAIHLPGRCTALPTEDGEGEMAGAEEALRLIKSGFTVTELPDDASPQEVVRICATAVKEKNFALVRRTMHPIWPDEHLTYRYEINLRRYRDLYVHAQPEDEVTIVVIRGEKIDSDEAFFLTEEDQETILKAADPLVEQAEVRVRRYNERGTQEGSPAPVWLRREDGGPWRIWDGFPI